MAKKSRSRSRARSSSKKRKRKRSVINWKISRLRKHGIPFRQAVAMSLSMYRAGRLGPRGGYVRVRKSRSRKKRSRRRNQPRTNRMLATNMKGQTPRRQLRTYNAAAYERAKAHYMEHLQHRESNRDMKTACKMAHDFRNGGGRMTQRLLDEAYFYCGV